MSQIEVITRLKRERAQIQRRLTGLGNGFRGTMIHKQFSEDIEFYDYLIQTIEKRG